MFKFLVKVQRNYYGEIQSEERVIEGENYERAKFEFNNRYLDWYIIEKIKQFIMNEPLSEGDRVKLVSMSNDPDPIKVGTQGTVTSANKMPNEMMIYGMRWDDGRSLTLLEGEDEWEKL